jgi:methylenetetrahydrofolate reductase (NADPH)
MACLRDMGVTQRCAVLAGVGPIRSLRMLEFLRSDVPGVNVPGDVERRLRGVPADRVAEEGMTLCAETIQQLTDIPGVAGVHVMAFDFERGVPEILERAGIAPREDDSVLSAADGAKTC